MEQKNTIKKKEKRGSFIFYRSWQDGNFHLSEKNLGQLYILLIQYALDRKKPKMKNLPKCVQGAFLSIQPLVDKDYQRYENGLKGGAPSGNSNAKKKQPENNQKTTENQLQFNLETTDNQPKDNPTHINILTNTNINNDIDNSCCNLNVSKKVSKKEEINNLNNNIRVRACNNSNNIVFSNVDNVNNKIETLDSYDKILDDLEVRDNYRHWIIEFIKHCQLNGKTITNQKLKDTIFRLDFSYKDDKDKVESLKNAIRSGYFDIQELKNY